MSNQQAAMDFRELARQVQQDNRYWGQDQLAIWGGRCGTEADVLQLLQKWPKRDEAMPYRIWEYSDRIDFEEKKLPQDAHWLERGRLFGPGGDLEVRRDGDRFYWRFVGRAGARPPDGSFHALNFWTQTEPGTRFFHSEDRALLWGERREGFDHWFDDRVARARLNYPWDKEGRVQVKYRTFSRAGQVEFVWLLGLESYDG